ncbi:hypothetical protein V6N13_114362 [Hibiscus sabdariffa]|uniref:Uncharacterized protein n=1 Tax=Hibiscus sabdariffa TaxID=183260 RepID=A0ABR2U1T9_9ROSI
MKGHWKQWNKALNDKRISKVRTIDNVEEVVAKRFVPENVELIFGSHGGVMDEDVGLIVRPGEFSVEPDIVTCVHEGEVVAQSMGGP